MESGARRGDLLVVALHAALVVAGTLRHEMWRDEHQAWLVARDAGSLSDVVRNLAYDGHPALWHSLLFVVTRLTHDPIAMQVFHAGIAIAVGALLVLAAPFPRWVRRLLPFGYLFLFEYGLISRSYALSALLAFGYCARRIARARNREPEGGRRETGALVPWVLLALLANTNAFGMLVALALAGGLLLELGSSRPRARVGIGFVAGAFVFVLGVLFSVSCTLPNEGSTFPLARPAQALDAARLQDVLAQIGGVYVYLPSPGTHFWNTFLLPAGLRIVLAGIVVAGSALLLRRRPVAMFTFLLGTLLLAGAQYWAGLGWVRYVGFHVILLVACAWIALGGTEGAPARADSGRGSRPAKEPVRAATSARSSAPARASGSGPAARTGNAGAGRWVPAAVLALISVHIVSGLFAWVQDVRLPFSTSGRAAALLRASVEPQRVRGPADPGRPLVGGTDFIVSPLTSYLDTRMFFVERAEYGSFVIWDARRKPEYTFDDVRNAVRTAMNDAARPEGTLVFSVQPRYQQDGVVRPLEATMLDTDLRIELVHTVPPGIVEEEQYFIYSVKRVARAG